MIQRPVDLQERVLEDVLRRRARAEEPDQEVEQFVAITLHQFLEGLWIPGDVIREQLFVRAFRHGYLRD